MATYADLQVSQGQGENCGCPISADVDGLPGLMMPAVSCCHSGESMNSTFIIDSRPGGDKFFMLTSMAVA